jgi:hypothetical protein
LTSLRAGAEHSVVPTKALGERRQLVYQRSLEQQERTTYLRKQAIKDALASGMCSHHPFYERLSTVGYGVLGHSVYSSIGPVQLETEAMGLQFFIMVSNVYIFNCANF